MPTRPIPLIPDAADATASLREPVSSTLDREALEREMSDVPDMAGMNGPGHDLAFRGRSR